MSQVFSVSSVTIRRPGLVNEQKFICFVSIMKVSGTHKKDFKILEITKHVFGHS